MEKTKHTPGPWVSRLNRNDEINIYGEDNFWVALLPHQCVRSIEKQQKRNAHLIAAAPDLLESCKDLIHIAKQFVGRIDTGGKPPIDGPIQRAEKATQKAEGLKIETP